MNPEELAAVPHDAQIVHHGLKIARCQAGKGALAALAGITGASNRLEDTDPTTMTGVVVTKARLRQALRLTTTARVGGVPVLRIVDATEAADVGKARGIKRH